MLLLFQACLEELVAKPVKFQIQTIVFLDQFHGGGIDLWAGFRNLAVFIEWDFPVECQGREHEAFFNRSQIPTTLNDFRFCLASSSVGLGAFVGSDFGDHSAWQVVTARGQMKETSTPVASPFHSSTQKGEWMMLNGKGGRTGNDSSVSPTPHT